MDRSQINTKVEQSLESLEGAKRAVPSPYLLTRINARMAKEGAPNFWSRAGAFLSRPVIAAGGLAFFIAVNLLAVNAFDKKSSRKTSASGTTTSNNNYEFAINVSGIYDIENPEP